ncbi:MAG: ABC transporter substrate-binding protein [Oscillospiraceae bacterium]|jgi:putative aldouronate transport system substrate-binding protein|nr:ABC transporter substrate-binding protein [Oscillospiraceae bacterium]
MLRKCLPLMLAIALVIGLAPAASMAEELPYAKIDWYLGLTPATDLATVNDALNVYLKEKINTEVNIVMLESTEWEQRMGTMLASGQDLGIVGFGSQSKSDYVIESRRGSYLALDDMLDTYATGTKALFSDEIWDAMRINGSIYGIPTLKDNGYYISLIWNDTMAQELGIDPLQGQYRNFRDLEGLLLEAKEKRDAAYPEWADRPISWSNDRVDPYNFAIEFFLNENYVAACNIEGIMDVAGYDTETVFNFFETPEFLEYAIQRQRMVDEGIYAYDYTDRSEWQYDGSIFAFIGWGYAYMPEHLFGENFVTKMRMSEHIWTATDNFHSAGTAISANCKNPVNAIKALELINTDPFVATMVRFGVEGIHYNLDENGDMTFEGTSNEVAGSRAFHFWYNAPAGNLTIVKAPVAYSGPDNIMMDTILDLNQKALLPPHLGFVFDPTPVANQVAAVTNVVLEYKTDLFNGRLSGEEEVREVVEEFIEKLRANGSEAIVAEAQKQIDAWKAAQ